MARKKKRGAPQKSCPRCNTVVHARTAECPTCSYVFVKKKKKAKKAVGRKATAKKRVIVRKKRRGRPAGGGGASFSVADIQAGKSLIGKVGSTSKAKRLLDALG